MSEHGLLLSQVRETSGETVTIARVVGAAYALKTRSRIGVRVERNDAASNWLHSNGWQTGAPDEPFTVIAYPDDGDLVVELPEEISSHFQTYDSFRLTLERLDISGRGAWFFDEPPVTREKPAPPQPIEAATPVGTGTLPPPPPPLTLPPPPPPPSPPPTLAPPLPRGSDAQRPKWLWPALAIVPVAIVVAVLWGVFGRGETGDRDGAAVLREARAEARGGNCAKSASLAQEAVERFGYGPAMMAIAEAYDPSRSEPSCLIANSRKLADQSLDYYRRACEAGESGAKRSVEKLEAWLEEQPGALAERFSSQLAGTRTSCGIN